MEEKIVMNGNIGAVLRKYRLERGITREELSRAVNIAHGTLEAYESGRIMPQPETVSRLMEEMSKTQPLAWSKMGFGPWLRKELKARGLANSWLAKQTGITRRTVLRYINSESTPKIRIMREIEDALKRYDQDPEKFRLPKMSEREMRRRYRAKNPAENGTQPDMQKVCTAIRPETITSIRRRVTVGHRLSLPVRSLDPETGTLATLRHEAVTVCGVYPYVAVFRRKNGMKESYTWQELVGMGV